MIPAHDAAPGVENEESRMADPNGGDQRGSPQVDLIFGLPRKEPEAGAESKAAEGPEERDGPGTLADILATLERMEAQLDALNRQSREQTAGTERSAEAPGDAETAVRALRGSVDAAAAQTVKAREELSGRLAQLETAVDGLPAAKDAKRVAELLELALSNLVGLSERVGGLERRLSERFKPIDRAAVSVRETSNGLAATAKTLDAAARDNARMLPTVTGVHGEVRRLRRAAAWGWGVVGGLVLLLFLLLAEFLAGRIGKWLTQLEALVPG